MDPDLSQATIWEHIGELRKVILRVATIIGTAIASCFWYYQEIIAFLKAPLSQQGIQLVLLGPLEGLLITMKTCCWIGIVISSPLWLAVAAHFVFPGLYPHEKRMAIIFFLLTLLFGACGIFFAFYLTVPLANAYLHQFNESLGLNMWSLEHYLDYTLFLLLANACAFELGAIGVLAVQLKLISGDMLAKKRRHAIVGSFIVAALLTPPDILTQFLLAIPLIVLYEGLIWYARLKAYPKTSVG